MKVVAINEVHYTDKKTGKPKIAAPLEVFDVPKAEAEMLTKGVMPAARRMTDAEIELDKLRAAAIANGSKDDDGDEDGDEDDTAAITKPRANANQPEPSKSAVVKPGSAAAQSAKADAKAAAKDDAGGY